MKSLNGFIFFLIFAFAGLLVGVYCIKPYHAPVSIVPVEKEDPWHAFTGRVVMPSVDDFYVLENSADRDLEKFERFCKGVLPDFIGLHPSISRNMVIRGVERLSRMWCSESS